MTYQEFKDYLATFLWKENDQALVNNLDSLIVMADAELNRKLDITRREALFSVSHVGDAIDLPADFFHLTDVSLQGQGCFNMTKNQFNNLKASFQGSPNYRAFHLQGRQILLPQEYTADNPGAYDITYRTKLPDYKTTDTSWMADDYLDCYVYTILKHTAPFLREDERVGLWTQLSGECVMSVIDDDKFNKRYAGGPLNMTVPTRVYGDPTAMRMRTIGYSY
ncbi:MAG: hypothetical protein GKR86_00050 [Ilumatobacter sp.]|nr:hypothetical protein [Ilumatobacter sp.]